MKILYGKFETEQFLVTCHAQADLEHVYMYEIVMTNKLTHEAAMINQKRLPEGSFELIVELVKRGRSFKQIKRLFSFMDKRNLIYPIWFNLRLKQKDEYREGVKAYLSRKCLTTAGEKLSDLYSEEFIENVLDIITGSTLK